LLIFLLQLNCIFLLLCYLILDLFQLFWVGTYICFIFTTRCDNFLAIAIRILFVKFVNDSWSRNFIFGIMIDRLVVLNERSCRKLGLVGGSFVIVEIGIIQQVACFSLLLLIANIPFSFSNYLISTLLPTIISLVLHIAFQLSNSFLIFLLLLRSRSQLFLTLAYLNL
jgi:hypothetical protein